MQFCLNWRFLILSCLSCLLLFAYLGKIALIDPDEPRYAEGAREMLLLKEYIIPHLNFQPRINKPVLFYWLILIPYKFFGINEFSARFSSAFFGLLLILGIYLFLRSEIGERYAYLASLVLMSTPMIFVVSRLAITDIVFVTFVLFSLHSFWYSFRNKRFLILAHLFLGLSLATKGPAGFILVFLTLLSFSLWQKNRTPLIRFFNLKGILTFFTVGCFWYLLLLNRVGWPELKNFIVWETLGRLKMGFIHKEPFYYYLPIILLGFLPWSVFLINFRKIDLEDKFIKYLLTFVLVTFSFFSLCQTKLPTYILPLFPALSVITVNVLNRFWDSKTKKTIILFLILASVSVMLLILSTRLLIFTNLNSISKISSFILFLALPLICFCLIGTKLKYQFYYLFSLPFLIYFYLTFNFGDDFSLYRSTKGLFENKKIETDVIFSLNLFKPSIVFYSGKRLVELDDISKFQEGYIIIKRQQFCHVLKRKPALEIISQTDKYYLLRLQKLQN